MEDRKKDLPSNADANKNEEDTQLKNQEEFDDQSREALDEKSRKEQAVKNEQQEDSQLKHEDMVPPEKEKQTEKWDKVDRQFPNLRK